MSVYDEYLYLIFLIFFFYREHFILVCYILRYYYFYKLKILFIHNTQITYSYFTSFNFF